MAKISSIRLLISLAASCHWPLHHLDIKNAFLHGDLHETVYMEQPPGFIAQGEYGMVCKLKKTIYGLRQSPQECQFLSSPRVPHWEAVIRILKYLKGAPRKGLLFRDHGHMKLMAYSDADLAVKRSTMGHCVFFGGFEGSERGKLIDNRRSTWSKKRSSLPIVVLHYRNGRRAEADKKGKEVASEEGNGGNEMTDEEENVSNLDDTELAKTRGKKGKKPTKKAAKKPPTKTQSKTSSFKSNIPPPISPQTAFKSLTVQEACH
ncbi:hypothetical protein POM88_022104 [Heracleum sosnowskyi]|uniref:Reverse transcriptase Ty1/copia-type domain-containing protein n=1 Tax=Heracleum sosnowskyi TaxID=360622 RepID=A0AAD8IEP1_9APIA|nr:hypothetical protein POM88_022104 [Heracleum sosnowskyi]